MPTWGGYFIVEPSWCRSDINWRTESCVTYTRYNMYCNDKVWPKNCTIFRNERKFHAHQMKFKNTRATQHNSTTSKAFKSSYETWHQYYDQQNGLVEYARSRGGPKRTWLTAIAEWTVTGITAGVREAEDRQKWGKIVMSSKCWQRLREWLWL